MTSYILLYLTSNTIRAVVVAVYALETTREINWTSVLVGFGAIGWIIEIFIFAYSKLESQWRWYSLGRRRDEYVEISPILRTLHNENYQGPEEISQEMNEINREINEIEIWEDVNLDEE